MISNQLIIKTGRTQPRFSFPVLSQLWTEFKYVLFSVPSLFTKLTSLYTSWRSYINLMFSIVQLKHPETQNVCTHDINSYYLLLCFDLVLLFIYAFFPEHNNSVRLNCHVFRCRRSQCPSIQPSTTLHWMTT